MQLTRTLAALALTFTCAQAAWGQQAAPLRILVGFQAGGSVDLAARAVADKMKDSLGRPVVVENRPGAGGRIVAQAVKEAAPDGNTLMLAPFGVMVMHPMIYRSIKYDTTTDFTPIGNVVSFPLGLAIGPSTPARNLTELVNWLRANPARANFGSTSAGSMPHFLGDMLGEAVKLDMTHVPYPGGRALVSNLLGGQVAIGINTSADFVEFHRAGRLRIVAVSGARRSPQLPEVPTFKEQGIALGADAWFALFGPAGIPAAQVERLNTALQAALRAPDLVERMGKLDMHTVPGSAQELASRMAADKVQWAPVIKKSGFQGE